VRLEPLYRLRFRYPESFRAGDERLLIADSTYLPTLTGAIESDDGAHVLLTLIGHGAPHAEPQGRVVAAILHSADGEYAWLNDVLGVVSGEVRGKEVVLEVAELVWEPPGD
jgi:hypothetical protein